MEIAEQPPAFLQPPVEIFGECRVNAWRSEQLASATWSLGDSFKIIPAAACARSLLETAESFWVETVKLRETWRGIKLDCGKNGPDNRHWHELTKLIYMMLLSGKFDKKVPELAQTYGQIERTNVLTLMDKLARATSGAIHEDYQWLCNAVHPSVGGMLAFAAPMMRHDTNTHAFQWVCSEPIHFEYIKGTSDDGRREEIQAARTHDPAKEERETTIEEALARSAAFAVDVLTRTLADALRIIDDTTDHARAGHGQLCVLAANHPERPKLHLPVPVREKGKALPPPVAG